MGKFIHSMVTAAIVGLPISGSPVLAWDTVVISDPSTSVLYQTHACKDFKVPFSFKLYGFTLDSTVGEVGNDSSPKREIDVFFVTVGGFKTTDDQGNPIAVDFSEKPSVVLYRNISGQTIKGEGVSYPNERVSEKYGNYLFAGSSEATEDGEGNREPLQYATLSRAEKESMRWAMIVDEYSVDRSGAGKPATETFLGAKEFVPCAPPRPYSFSMPEVEANASVTDKLRIRVAMTPPPLGLRQTGSGLPVWRKGDKKFSISARLNDGAVRENVDEFVAFNLYQAESRNTIVDGTRLRYLNMEFDVSAAVIKLDDIQIQYAGGDLNKHGDPTAPAVWAVAGQYRAE